MLKFPLPSPEAMMAALPAAIDLPHFNAPCALCLIEHRDDLAGADPATLGTADPDARAVLDVPTLADTIVFGTPVCLDHGEQMVNRMMVGWTL